MPPAKNRNNDDSKSEATGKEKNGSNPATKIRRVASQQGTSGLREVQNASSTVANPPAEAVAPSVRRSSLYPPTQHACDIGLTSEFPYSFNGLHSTDKPSIATDDSTTLTLLAPLPGHSTRPCSHNLKASECTRLP